MKERRSFSCVVGVEVLWRANFRSARLSVSSSALSLSRLCALTAS